MATTEARFHPLEIIPFFRRFPCTATRNFAYTFIWNGLFAVVFYAISSVSDRKSVV